ncbi:MAG TPA: polysaccharide biosynthesis tyrosine autokinase [Terriglobia bacterium]|nr:polysaccharide biosynthesis tyrosine autokinase [Terriglobia bacterium]
MRARHIAEGRGAVLLPADSLSSARTSAINTPSHEWEHILRILARHWQAAAAFTLFIVGAATATSLIMKPVYGPKARLEIDPPGSEPLSMQDSVTAQFDEQDYFNTEAQNLKSDELAIEVIRKLKLDHEPSIVGSALIGGAGKPEKEPAPPGVHLSYLNSIALRAFKAWLSVKPPMHTRPSIVGSMVSGGAGKPEKQTSPPGIHLSYLESIALRAFKAGLSVKPLVNTRLVEVSFTSTDPVLAARVTNATVDLFIDRNFQTRYKATLQASAWLSGQLTDLRRKVEGENRNLVEYQKKNNILDTEDSNNDPVSEKVIDLNRQFIQAQADRIQLEAEEKAVESGNADALPEVQDNELIQSLTQNYAQDRAQLADLLTIYGRNDPAVKRLRSQVAEFTAQLKAERRRIVNGIRARYIAARARERFMSRAVDEMKAVINTDNQKMIRYKALKEDAVTNAQLYNSLLARIQEAGISAGLRSSNMQVVDRALILNRPTGPHRLRIIALGLIVGLVGGVVLALVKESMNTTTRSPEDVTDWTGLDALGAFPLFPSTNGRRVRPPAHNFLSLAARNGHAPSSRHLFLAWPESMEAEAVRSLRTAIMLRHSGRSSKVLLVASPSHREGRSTVAANLALALAQQARTCLIDGDLRKPSVALMFGVPEEPGLSNALSGSDELDALLRPVGGMPQLRVLPAGSATSNRELVAPQAIDKVLRAVRERFDFVVLDSPPIIPFADARVLSALADETILVVRMGATNRRTLTGAVQELSLVNASCMGVVVNGAKLAREGGLRI